MNQACGIKEEGNVFLRNYKPISVAPCGQVILIASQHTKVCGDLLPSGSLGISADPSEAIRQVRDFHCETQLSSVGTGSESLDVIFNREMP